MLYYSLTRYVVSEEGNLEAHLQFFLIAQKCHWSERKSDEPCACVASYLLIFLTFIVAFYFQAYLSITSVCGYTRYILKALSVTIASFVCDRT